jgi:hypothetical protein
VSTSNDKEEVRGSSADRFFEVMSAFVEDAGTVMAELDAAAASLTAAADSVCRFYCEVEDTSVPAAHALLQRVHGFGVAIVAAHDQLQKSRKASEAKAARASRHASASSGVASSTVTSAADVSEASAAPSTFSPPRASGGSGRANLVGNGATVDVEQLPDVSDALVQPSSASSLRTNPPLTRRQTAGASSRAASMSVSAEDEEEEEDSRELQQLFLRRASGRSIAKDAKTVAPSPIKRPRPE